MRPPRKGWRRPTLLFVVVLTAGMGCRPDAVAGISPTPTPENSEGPVRRLHIRPMTSSELENHESRALARSIDQWRTIALINEPVAMAEEADNRAFHMSTNVYLEFESYASVVAVTQFISGFAWRVRASVIGTWHIGVEIPVSATNYCYSFGSICSTGVAGDIDCEVNNGTKVVGKTIHNIDYFTNPAEQLTEDSHRCWRTSTGGHDDYVYENGRRCHYVVVAVSTDGGVTWTNFTATECE